MKTFTDGLSIFGPARWAAACVLLCALQGPVRAQDVAHVPPQQTLGPASEELFPNGTPGEPPQETIFGTAIARHGNTALINLRAYRDFTGRVAVFTRNASGTWERTGALDPPDGQPGDQFGNSLAVDEHAALIASSKGLYVYRRGRKGFTLIQTLRNVSGRSFSPGALWNGWAFVPSSDNGERSVRVYRITPRGLFLTQKLRSGEPSSDAFAESMAMFDGTLLISAPGDEAAYVFEPHRGLFWIKRQKLNAIDGAPGDGFGQAVALGDGVIAIGAPGVKINTEPGVTCGEGNFPYYFGFVYVFRRAPGHLWSQRQAIPAPTCVWNFGESVAASGKWIAAAGPGGGIFDPTMPVIYHRDVSGEYTAVASLQGSHPTVAVLNMRGNTLMVGLRSEHNFDVGDFGYVDVYLLDQVLP